MSPTSIAPSIAEKGYTHPGIVQVLREPFGAHQDLGIRVLESDEDVLLYEMGHIPGALKLDWHADLNDPIVRDYVTRASFESLLRSKGIDETTTVILYGDKNNWWACYAFWVFRLFDFANAKILDGGRAKWESEGRPMITSVPRPNPSSYTAPERSDARIRAFMDEVREHMRAGRKMVDVRSVPEFTGERTHMPEYPQEGTLRGGHIPGARSVPWARAANADGTFKSADELRAIYEQEHGLRASDDVIAYCRIGERSSHTWFVLTYLLGYDRVRNYDGSWTEWGNAVRVPIRTGDQP